VRATIASAHRLVVKVGSSSITRPRAGGVDDVRLDALVDALAARAQRGSQIVVVSSGAIAAGLAGLSLTARPRDLASAQAAASVGQGLLVASYARSFARHGRTVGQVLLTAEDLTRRAHYRNAQRTLERLVGAGAVPVVNENDTVATDEIRFGDNDRLAALVAHLVDADALVLLSDVAGLFDADPRTPGARLVDQVAHPDELAAVSLHRRGGSGVGTGGMASKVDAARVATADGVPVLLAAASDAAHALGDASVGTVFLPTGTRAPARTRWLVHASAPRGRLVLDAGAVAALRTRRASLLPAGVVGVEGTFAAGDPVELVDSAGVVVGRGLVAFDAAELPDLLGRSTYELAAAYGAAYEREVVHRDHLVLLDAPR